MDTWHLWEAPELPFNRRDILRYAGWPGGNAEKAELPLEGILRETAGIRCRAVWTLYPVIPLEDGTLDLGFMRSGSRALRQFLSECDELVLFALTAGVEMDRLIARESLRSPLRGLLAHAVGAERAETACDALETDIIHACPGRSAKGRFSPGYGDLPLDAQRAVFQALPAGKMLGMTLNEENIMSPSKSVTAVIGLKDRRECDADDPA